MENSRYVPNAAALFPGMPAFSLSLPPQSLQWSARRLPPPDKCAKPSLFTPGLIQCQFRMAHRFGPNCSFRTMESTARLHGRFQQGVNLPPVVRVSCCAYLLRPLVDCEQTAHSGRNILHEVTGCSGKPTRTYWDYTLAKMRCSQPNPKNK